MDKTQRIELMLFNLYVVADDKIHTKIQMGDKTLTFNGITSSVILMMKTIACAIRKH